MRTPLPALACALLLVLAGCSVGYQGPTREAVDGPDATATPTTPSTTTPEATPATTPAATSTATPSATPTPDPTPTTTPTATPTPDPTPTTTPSATPTATPDPTPTATPTATPTPTATATPDGGGDSPASGQGSTGGSSGDLLGGLFGDGEERIAVRGGSLPVDATLVFDRTRRLLGTEAPHPNAVQLLDTTANTTSPPEFQRLLGLERNVSEVEAAAFVIDGRTVYVNRNITDDPAFLEHVLAHEFTHTVQFRRGHIAQVQTATAIGPDGRFASTAVIEGAATYAQDGYWRRHMADRERDRGTRPALRTGRNYRNSTGAAQYAFAPYWFGYRYANATLDSPAQLRRLYADPPTTSEQVLHRLPPGSEPPVPLAVRLRGARTDTWQLTFVPRRARMGEAFLRVALDTELGADRARAAAAGWGNDTRIAFNNDSGARGYAWVVRFDDRANATEFDGAVRDYLDGRATRAVSGPAPGAVWETRLDGDPVRYRLRVDDRTAVLLTGVPAFVRTTTVETDDGAVTLAVD